MHSFLWLASQAKQFVSEIGVCRHPQLYCVPLCGRALPYPHPSGPPSPCRWASRLFPIFQQCWNEHPLACLPGPRGSHFPRSTPRRATAGSWSARLYFPTRCQTCFPKWGQQVLGERRFVQRCFVVTLMRCWRNFTLVYITEPVGNLVLLCVASRQPWEPIDDAKGGLPVYQLPLPSAACECCLLHILADTWDYQKLVLSVWRI